MFSNQLKTLFLLVLLTVLLMGVGSLIGGTTGLIIAFLFALLINLLGYWYSDKIVLMMYKAKEATKDHKLNDIVRDVSHMASIPKPKVYIIHDKHANAFATGRDYKHASVVFTDGILELLDEDELKGVIAHEISHIRNKDILIGTIAGVIAGSISYLVLFARFGNNEDTKGNLISIIVLAIVAPIIAAIIKLAISRSREFLADETGAKIIKNPVSLANALAKLHSGVRANRLTFGNEATAHLFIVNPFDGGGLKNLLSTHPPISQRIGRLRSMKV
ncbi:MAG TPA: M48 family metalloprotease [Candidatus Nanoarchaeia archaeon]|nr:M48 family metalloprotease [Candidatus Nanoarchaeia archaeon]